MVMIEVWAPGHHQVELVLDGQRRLAMAVGERGWWRRLCRMPPGTVTSFRSTAAPPAPTLVRPGSPAEYDGPFRPGRPRPVRLDRPGLARARLSPGAVLYELHVGTFSPEGTFDGAISRLAHLVGLGVNAIELLPVAEASGSQGWGYDGADLWAPHHAYGGPDGLKRLVDACHARGVAVVLDVVYNHLGPAGNYLCEFGPYFTDSTRHRGAQPSTWTVRGSYGARDFVISNALMWLRDYHFDGLRLDAVHAIYDESALHVLEELAGAVAGLAEQIGRELWVIAESDRNDPRLCRSRESHGYGVSASWDDDFHHALHTVLTGENSGYYVDFGRVAQLAKAFTDAYVYDGEFSEFRQRRHGRPADDLSGACFVCCLQNHDQVGNRAFGERTAALVGPDLLKVGAALLLLSPFLPMLFQGEEWGASTPFLYFTDHQDAELGAAVREGRRREHPMPAGAEVPDPQDPGTFLRSKLDWSELDREPHRSVLDWHRRLIALRLSEPDLLSHDRRLVGTAFDEEARWLVVNRGRFSIAANLADKRQPLPLDGGASVVMASDEGVEVETSDGGASVWLPPRSVAVLAH